MWCLPVHAWVVHGGVVLLRLMAIMTAVVVCIPRWRARAAWPVAVIDAGMVAMTFVARQSGEALQARLGGQIAPEHAAVGSNLILLACALFLRSVVVEIVREDRPATASEVTA